MATTGNRAQNNRGNQMTPNNAAYRSNRQDSGESKPAQGNRSNQLDPNHAASRPDATNGSDKGSTT